MRIGLAITTLWDLLSQSPYPVKFYTDQGVLPRQMLGTGWRVPSVYILSGSPAFVASMFILHALLAILLLVGYRTRLATIGCLVMTWSLCNRNPLITGGADELLAWLLIWSVFLPLGETWSIDRFRRAQSRPAINSPASMALLLQVVLIYLGANTSRLHSSDWAPDFTAVYYILKSNYGTPPSHAIARWPMLTVFMTAGSLMLEWLGPLAALFSWRWPTIRTSIVILFCLFHLMIGLTIYTGFFPLICIVAWMPFVPGEAWGWLVQSHPVRSPPQAGHASRQSLLANAAVTMVFAYVACVNLASDLPLYRLRLLEPINRLPKCKQFWQMMAAAPHSDMSVRIEGQTESGESIVLLDASQRAPSAVRDFLWPPEDTLDRSLPERAVRLNAGGNPEFLARLCEWHRRQWEKAHPTQRVRRVQVTCLVSPVPQFDPSDLSSQTQVQSRVFEWQR